MLNIPTIRLHNQLITNKVLKTPKEVVAHMGALQAQDYQMVKWGVGLRLPNATNSLIDSALSRGEILRTHVLRPTWHLVVPEDVRWMLMLTAPRIKSTSRAWAAHLGVDDKMLSRCHKTVEKVLVGNKQLTREEISSQLAQVGITLNNHQVAHVMMQAELDCLVCSGAPQGRKQTYTLMDERVIYKKLPYKDEALAMLARKFFTSHGPATLPDFSWWSGLPMAAARHALEMVKKEFSSEAIDEQTYWFSDNSCSTPADSQKSCHFLPAFDEYIVSYKDRQAVLHVDHYSKAISSNGIFKPTIVDNGQVIGLWKKEEKTIRVQLFENQSINKLDRVRLSAERLKEFWR
ncbi:MAG: winged helix DNA-binding domain-containing protein [Prevotellaceae bacterium]|jgi:hypothetical protein|nr:winged helix DNA-binding domain-containing protein [Prevotellaceae bacterium]